jgi:biotin-dependent carboxylase-like uncharacterized protein
MSRLLVDSPGLLTTVQDLGRPGYGFMGVSPSGAADPVALRLGNLLVGNHPGAAALEMTLLGGQFVLPEGGVVACTGANFDPAINGCPAEMWTTHKIAPGGMITFGPTRDFARSYLAIGGGVRVAPFLGSTSTHMLSGLGGQNGGALRKGDVLHLGARKRVAAERRLWPPALMHLQPHNVLRVTEGPQIAAFSESSKESLFRSTFQVSEESDRMGIRLEGPSLSGQFPGEMITEGVPLGAIQVTSSGQLIILFVEQQTTGGYPKIANVIGVDLHRLGQLRPRTEIRFERTSLAVARSLWIDQERLLNNPKQLLV